MDTTTPSPSELREAFAKFDADGNGFLTSDELVGIFTRPGGGNPMTEAQARAFIQEHDRNGDGRLDLDEFTVSMVGLEGFTLTGVTLPVLRRLRESAVEKRAAATR